MEIKVENIVLRDMKKSDIEDYVRWFTTETEWMDWDAPWEAQNADAETEHKRWTEEYESVKTMAENTLRWRFEIEYGGKHIGWVSSYLIDENYDWIDEQDVRESQKVYRTVGIDIVDPSIRSKGLGTNALRGFIQYYVDRGCKEICTETWSGNIRMIRVAEKLGFRECNRVADECEVRGKQYDGLTFRMGFKQKVANMETRNAIWNVDFIPVEESEASILGLLRQKAWAATYRGVYPDEMIDQFDYAWHRERDLLRIRSSEYQNYLIQLHGKNVGYLVLKNEPVLLLQSLYLLPEAQKKGIGRQSFAFIRQYCAERGIQSFRCHCQPDNKNAMGFYEKMGGVIVDRDEGNEERWQDSAVFAFQTIG